MAFSQRENEGYLRIDNRESPGLNEEQSRKVGMPFVGRGRLFEAPIYKCSHCERGVVVNAMRTRDRAYCPKCDHVICDLCEAERVRTGVCRPFKQIEYEFMNNAAKGA